MCDQPLHPGQQLRLAVMAALLGMTATAAAQINVYATEFSDVPDQLWSSDRLHTLPIDANRCLGRFSNETVTLTLEELPEHAMVRVAFDLLLIRTWDGNSRRIGPDIWQMETDDGRMWVNHTFANMGEDALADYNGEPTQSFPAVLPGRKAMPASGAASRNAMRYDLSSRYRVAFTFPHTADQITFSFRGRGLQHVDNESWAIDNVRVAVLQPGDVRAASTIQLENLITMLRTREEDPAYWAMLEAVEQGDRFTAQLAIDLDKRLGKISNNAITNKCKAWIRQLDHDAYAKREAATKALAANLAVARGLVEAALENDNTTPEQRLRLQRILSDQPPTQPIDDPNQRLALRLIRTLELIGTADAKDLIAQIKAKQTAP